MSEQTETIIWNVPPELPTHDNSVLLYEKWADEPVLAWFDGKNFKTNSDAHSEHGRGDGEILSFKIKPEDVVCWAELPKLPKFYKP